MFNSSMMKRLTSCLFSIMKEARVFNSKINVSSFFVFFLLQPYFSTAVHVTCEPSRALLWMLPSASVAMR